MVVQDTYTLNPKVFQTCLHRVESILLRHRFRRETFRFGVDDEPLGGFMLAKDFLIVSLGTRGQ